MVEGAPHQPHYRPLPLAWRVDDVTQRTVPDWSAGVSDGLFEVYCLQCGDDMGRTEDQPERARALRGPWTDRDARMTARKHRNETVAG